MTDYSSFILKIRVDERRQVLMGSIQHVATQDSLRFREMGRMMQFIFAHVSPEELGERASVLPDAPVECDTASGLRTPDCGPCVSSDV